MRPFAFALCLLTTVTLSAVDAWGQQPSQQDVGMMAKGRVTYRIYCTSCHGPKGLGDGKLADFLEPRPANLTTMTAQAQDGKFPEEMVRQVIDGRHRVPGHGGGEMPAWGEVFQGLEEGGNVEPAVRQRIAELVVFLQSIQEPPSGAPSP